MQAVKTEAQPHATTRTYLSVAGVLTVLTLIEFGVVFVPGLGVLLVPILLALAAGKFALVAMFFMHLKFDSRVFAVFFASGLVIATLVAVVLKIIMLA